MDEIEELKKIQIVTKDILDEVVRVCEMNGIKYYLAYGTLLGAVRHKGFIPWDDDIDIWMLRDDYNKFVSIANNFFNDEYFLQNSDTDGCFPVAMSKVRINGTHSFEKSFGDKGNKGIFIDIFPLDKYPNDIKAANRIWKICCKINKCLVLTYLVKSEHRSINKNIIIAILKIILNRKILKKLLFSIFDRNNQLCSTKCGSHIEAPFEFFDIDDFGKDTYLQFEGKEYRVPQNYDYILKQIYGDYMKLPPVEERKHHFKDVDFGSYFDNID